MRCQNYLTPRGSFSCKFCDDGEHAWMQTDLGFIDRDQGTRVWAREDAQQHQEPNRSIRQIRGRLLSVERSPPYPELNSLICCRWENQLFEIRAEGRAHGGIDRLFEIAVSGVERVKNRYEILPVRRYALLEACDGSLANYSLLVDMEIVIDAPGR